MGETITNSVVFQAMEQWAPKKLAYDWDPVGLQIGSFRNEVKNVLLTLDVTKEVVDEAIKKDVQLIIAHHPMFFKPLQQINLDRPQGELIQKLIQHNISVYAAHTNLDIAKGGVNDMLFNRLGLENGEHLQKIYTERLYKIIVFVPESHQEVVKNALGDAGAGHIGNYSHCTFQTKGQGTFKPLDGANPYIGTNQQLALVDEIKIESIVKEQDLSKVIESMVEAHPYEEVAYDVHPLKNEGEQYGIGKVGYLQESMPLKNFADHVKKSFQLTQVRVTGDEEKEIKKVAVLGGSGEKFIQQAIDRQVDAYVTGDITFHRAQSAWDHGLSIIDAGHYIEKVMKEGTRDYLRNFFDTNLTIHISEVNTDPFWFK